MSGNVVPIRRQSEQDEGSRAKGWPAWARERVWETLRSGLPPAAKLVDVVLTLRADERDRRCFPGLDRIQHDTGLSLQGVVDAIAELERRGRIRVLRKGARSPSGQWLNAYEVLPGGEIGKKPSGRRRAHTEDLNGVEAFNRTEALNFAGQALNSVGESSQVVSPEAVGGVEKRSGTVHRTVQGTVKGDAGAVAPLVDALRSIPGRKADDRKDAELLRDLATEFPDANLLFEIKAAAEWCVAKRLRRPGTRAFLRNWLERSSGTGDNRSPATRRPSSANLDGPGEAVIRP